MKVSAHQTPAAKASHDARNAPIPGPEGSQSTGPNAEVTSTTPSNGAPSDRFEVGQIFNHKVVANVYAFLTDHELWAQQNRELLNHFGDDAPKDPQVLDLGSGTGIGTLAIADALQGRGKVIGVDFSKEMAAKANEQTHDLDNVSFQQGDATNLGAIETNSQDFVVANSFLYLVPDRAAVLKEARRVLKPGGRVVFMEPREEGSLLSATAHASTQLKPALAHPTSAFRLGLAMVAWRTMSGIEGRPREEELRSAFLEAGFSKVDFEPTLGGIGHHVIAS